MLVVKQRMLWSNYNFCHNVRHANISARAGEIAGMWTVYTTQVQDSWHCWHVNYLHYSTQVQDWWHWWTVYTTQVQDSWHYWHVNCLHYTSAELVTLLLCELFTLHTCGTRDIAAMWTVYTTQEQNSWHCCHENCLHFTSTGLVTLLPCELLTLHKCRTRDIAGTLCTETERKLSRAIYFFVHNLVNQTYSVDTKVFMVELHHYNYIFSMQKLAFYIFMLVVKTFDLGCIYLCKCVFSKLQNSRKLLMPCMCILLLQ